MASDARNHKWRFFRAGDFDQVRLDSGADLLALEQLDQKLWVALACPINGVEFDKKTLELIDTDKDGRIRAPELLAAVKWAGSVLKDLGGIVKGPAGLPLSAIDERGDEGKRLLASARQILVDLGKPEAKEITLEDTADTAKIFGQTKFNGDGVVPAASAEDEATGKVIEDIIACLGGAPDRSGLTGVTQEKVDQFFTEAAAMVDWSKTPEADPAINPLGEGTAAAVEAFGAVRAKIDDFFARCRLAAFDPRAAGHLNRDEAEYSALAPKLLGVAAEEVAAFPLARVEAGKALPLAAGVNPSWAAAIKKFHTLAVTPLLGDRDALSEADWDALAGKLAPFGAWNGGKPATQIEKLGVARLREITATEARATITALIAKDKALEPEASAILSVDKLIRYHRHLYALVTNFVSFSTFYSRKKAIFQIGTLYLDGRSFDLCVKVTDAGAHATAAAGAGVYLAYCDVTRKGTGEKMTIAAAITGGDSDELAVGRNGIFYDREGNDWDATIVKLVDQPISVRQAFWLPYKRVSKLIGEQINKFASSREKEMNDKAAANVATGAKVADAPAAAAAAPPAPPFDIGKFAGIFAGIGIALGAIGSVLLAIVSGFLSLKIWQMPLAIGAIILVISCPSMFLAYLKLRKRNLGPILDANGWAVNARARINVPFGASFTSVAALPSGAERSMSDPYAEKSSPWGLYLFLLLAVAAAAAWKLGYAAAWMDDLKAATPAASASAAASAAPPK